MLFISLSVPFYYQLHPTLYYSKIHLHMSDSHSLSCHHAVFIIPSYLY